MRCFAIRLRPAPWLGLLLLLLASGCRLAPTPTLRAAYAPELPPVNGRIESTVWNKAEPLRLTLPRSLAPGEPGRPLELRALHDGRTLTLLTSWPDATEGNLPRTLVWNPQRVAYAPRLRPADGLTFLWPDGPPGTRPEFCMTRGAARSFDAWRWRNGWSTLSGYAEDGQLALEFTPARHGAAAGAAAAGHSGYPARGGRLLRVAFRPDPGEGGVVELDPPLTLSKPALPGLAVGLAGGDAADVRAVGIWQKAKIERPDFWYVEKDKRVPGYWQDTNPNLVRSGLYLVEWSRLLAPAAGHRDYPLRGPGPHYFAVSIADEAIAPDHYASGAVRLVLERKHTD